MAAAEPSPLFFAKNLAAWRRWLRAHREKDRFVWLVFLKGDKRDDGVSYGDALDEALCWGWIDTMVRRIDDERYARKFTQRVNATKWSDTNVKRLRRLLAEKRMQPPGLALVSPETLRKAKAPEATAKKSTAKKSAAKPPEELERALAKNAKARRFFETLAPSYRRNYTRWVADAKQSVTRTRRAEEAVSHLAKGEKTLLK